MIVVSNNVKTNRLIPLPIHAIIRINMAWIETREELEQLIRNNKRHVFLDFPKGRTKPPTPILQLNDAIAVMKRYKRIKYFAVSNAEQITDMLSLRKVVPDRVKIIPKIETITGVNNLLFLVKAAETDIIMLDKEDLYLSARKSNSLFNKLVTKVRHVSNQENIKVLELQGVIFAERK